MPMRGTSEWFLHFRGALLIVPQVPICPNDYLHVCGLWYIDTLEFKEFYQAY